MKFSVFCRKFFSLENEPLADFHKGYRELTQKDKQEIWENAVKLGHEVEAPEA